MTPRQKSSHWFLFAVSVLLIQSASSVLAANYSSPKDIGSFMEKLHKGKTSYAVLARQGKLNSRQLTALAKQYRIMLTMTPPKNKEVWRQSVSNLILATQRLARKPTDRSLLAAYAKAVDCNACHRKHR